MDRPAEAVVRDSLYNWLGFGNLNGKYWFIGREESLSLTKCDELDDWTDYFETRAQFPLATDFRQTWEDRFGRRLATFGTTTWHYQIAFLLALHGREITSSSVKGIFSTDPRFCRTFSNHFSGEFFPCPKSSKNTIEPYSHIWESVQQYHAEVTEGRLSAFSRALENNRNVDLIITYSPNFAREIASLYPKTEIDRWDNVAMDPLVLSQLEIARGREVYLLETPFLGHGRIGYDAIAQVVNELPTL